MRVQSLHQPLNDMCRHAAVDLSGQLDEPGRDAILPRLPREIKGVDRDAVTTEARTRIERLEAERFRLGGLDDVPYIDAPPLEGDLQLVHQGDVDRAKDVLEDLRRLGNFRRRYGHDAV